MITGALLILKISEFDFDTTKQWADTSEWRGLEIIETSGGGAGDTTGKIEFVATYAANASEYRHHELSDFKKIGGKWYFIDGTIQNNSIKRSEPKIGRNDPCPCGSGKKYKKCCL